jgi:(2Fe-2S) ferredoxin
MVRTWWSIQKRFGLAGVTLADVDEIIESHMVGGKPVERLMLRDSCINTLSCEHKPRAGIDQ